MFETVAKVISDCIGISVDKIHIESHLVNDIGLTSLDTVQVICELEDILNFEIPEDDIMDFRTVGDVVEYLEKIVQ